AEPVDCFVVERKEADTGSDCTGGGCPPRRTCVGCTQAQARDRAAKEGAPVVDQGPWSVRHDQFRRV
ncbi:hypothetical protein BHE74_00055517, partial [Ensete ventricosum]